MTNGTVEQYDILLSGLSLTRKIEYKKRKVAEGSRRLFVCGSLFSTNHEDSQLFDLSILDEEISVGGVGSGLMMVDGHMRSINALRLTDNSDQLNNTDLSMRRDIRNNMNSSMGRDLGNDCVLEDRYVTQCLSVW